MGIYPSNASIPRPCVLRMNERRWIAVDFFAESCTDFGVL